MHFYERLYDEQENTNVRYVGFTANDIRYDFAIVFTNLFFGKPLFICLQSGRSSFLDEHDLRDVERLQSIFRIETIQHAKDLANYISELLPSISIRPQYE